MAGKLADVKVSMKGVATVSGQKRMATIHINYMVIR